MLLIVIFKLIYSPSYNVCTYRYELCIILHNCRVIEWIWTTFRWGISLIDISFGHYTSLLQVCIHPVHSGSSVAALLEQFLQHTRNLGQLVNSLALIGSCNLDKQCTMSYNAIQCYEYINIWCGVEQGRSEDL